MLRLSVTSLQTMMQLIKKSPSDKQIKSNHMLMKALGDVKNTFANSNDKVTGCADVKTTLKDILGK